MKKSVLNLGCLTAIQAANAVMPLVVFPFALSAVGAFYYSKLVVGEALAIFLLAVVLYSFEIDGVAGVVGADPEKDREKLSKLLCSVVITRVALFCVALPVLLGVAWCLDKQLLAPALAWSLIPLSYAVSPNWFFQGLGQNGFAAGMTVVSRAAAVAAPMLLVDAPSDYLLVPVLVGTAYLAGAAGCLAYAFVRHKLSIGWPGAGYLRASLFNGRFVFLGNLGVVLYRDANVLVLAALGSSSAVIAAYSLSEKLVKSIQAAIRPLNQHFMPHAMRIAQQQDLPQRAVLGKLLRLTLPQMAAMCVLAFGLYIFYPWGQAHIPVVRNIGNLEQVIPLIGVMCIGALFGIANFMLGSAGLNAQGHGSYLFRAIVAAGVTGVVTCSVAGAYLGAYGAALAFVAAELSLQVIILKKYFTAPRGELSWTF